MSIDRVTTAEVRKFMFDYSFDEADVVHRAPERKPVLMKPDQIDALKKESYGQGFRDGEAAGKQEQIALQNDALQKIGGCAEEILKTIGTIAQEHEHHTRQLALAIAKKVLPTFIAQNGIQEIEALVNDALRDMSREPRLVVRVHESEFSVLDEKIRKMAEQRAFPGQLVILADEAVETGDCRIEWSDGGVERNVGATMGAAEQTLLPSS